MPKLKNNFPKKYLINLANKLSEINQFETSPNPCVGAVGIDKNNHIHLGVTGKHGSPHAEFALLKTCFLYRCELLINIIATIMKERPIIIYMRTGLNKQPVL